MGVWLVARDNIKKKKGNAILLFFMIAFAVMLLYVGISVLTNLESNVDERNDLMNGADFMIISSNSHDSEILNKIRGSQSVTYAESEKGLYQSNVKFYETNNESDTSDKIDFLFQQKDIERVISAVAIIDQGETWTCDSIILPYYMKVGLGYRTGDAISLVIDNEVYGFTVYGFMDDVMFSTPINISTERVFIDNDMYDELASRWDAEVTIYKAVINASTDLEDFQRSMDEQLKTSIPEYADSVTITLNYATMRTGTCISAYIFMGILTVFAILLIMIAMIIIKFNITNSIEMNMRNIGILQATGYTGKQLMAATILENMIIGIFGMAAGLILARVTSAIIGGVIAASIGMFWGIGFDADSAVYSVLVTLVMVFAAALIGALKYGKIGVLDALRNGIRTHNFKKTHVHLDSTSLPLNIALGVKNVFSRRAKNIVIALIIALLTFCSNAALSMYRNFILDDSNLLAVTGFEVPTVGIRFDADSKYTLEDVEAVEDRIRLQDGIEEIRQYTCSDMTCSSESGSELISCDAYDDTNLHVDNIVEGRRPQNDDEIMLSTVMEDRLQVTVGDVVYLEMNGSRQDYVVCGVFQGINHLGKKVLVNFDGIRRLDADIVPNMLYVYGSDSVSTDDLISTITDEIHDDSVTVTNFQDYISASMASIVSIMEIFSYIIISAVGLVIALVMMFLVKTQLVKDRRQYGIYKALGYTTGQLLLQTTMNYLPVVIAGTVTGCILSVFLMDPLFVVCLSMFGIRTCSMEIGFQYMLLMLVVVIMWSLLIIVVNSFQIRKIVPCEMIQEN